MQLDETELKFIRCYLNSRKAYRYSPLPLGAHVWEDWMENLLQKVENELKAQS